MAGGEWRMASSEESASLLVYRMGSRRTQAANPIKLANRAATLPNAMNPIMISKIRWPNKITTHPKAGSMD
jgi:hypothetical protein